MNKKIITAFMLLGMTLYASDLVQMKSSIGVDACVDAMQKTIYSKKGFGVFAVIDHRKNAQKVGLDLPAQKVIIFGNPKAGTMLMKADAQIGYDLPLRIMVRQSGKQTVIEYRDPLVYSDNYHINKSPLPQKMHKLLGIIAASCQK